MPRKVGIDGRLYFDRERDREHLKEVEAEKERLRKQDPGPRPAAVAAPTSPAPTVEIPTAGPAPAADPFPPATRGVIAIRNARVYPISGSPLERATVVVEDGRIKAVGKDAPIPAGARIIEGEGLRLYPGMIDANTEIGLSEIGSIRETSDTNENRPYTPQVRAYDGIHPESEHIPVTRVAGVTTALSLPSGGTLSGQPVLINLDGSNIQEMCVLRSAGISANLPTPGRTAEARKEYETRARELADLLDDARHYWKAREAATKDRSLPPVRHDERLEALVPLVRRQVPLFAFATSRPAIRAAVEFASRQKLRLVLVGAEEAGKLIDYLKGKDVAVIYGPVQNLPAAEDDPYDLPYATPALLAKADIPFAITTSSTSFSRTLPFETGTAAGNGLSESDALKAITLWPAQILGVADRLGSIEPGKIANLVITDGDLLEMRTNVRHVLINGRDVPLESRHTRLWQQYRDRK
jgi:imidazolonepropionase-like amidohydrolase